MNALNDMQLTIDYVFFMSQVSIKFLEVVKVFNLLEIEHDVVVVQALNTGVGQNETQEIVEVLTKFLKFKKLMSTSVINLPIAPKFINSGLLL